MLGAGAAKRASASGIWPWRWHRAGFVAIAPDVNAAYTGGWGEPANRESTRFGQVLTATVAELGKASRGLSNAFGIPLQGKANIARLGLIGHSRGGTNALGWAAGKRHVRSILLLAPAYDPARSIPDVLATVVLGTCDGDTGRQGAKYFAALRSKKRTHPAYKITLRPANHNFYNETLVALGADDAPADRPGMREPADRPEATDVARAGRAGALRGLAARREAGELDARPDDVGPRSRRDGHAAPALTQTGSAASPRRASTLSRSAPVPTRLTSAPRCSSTNST